MNKYAELLEAVRQAQTNKAKIKQKELEIRELKKQITNLSEVAKRFKISRSHLDYILKKIIKLDKNI